MGALLSKTLGSILGLGSNPTRLFRERERERERDVVVIFIDHGRMSRR